VGKSTVARLLAARFERAVVLEADRFFDFIAAGRIDPWKPESHAQNEIAMRAVADAALAYARGGYFTIVEGIVIPTWFLEPLRDAFGAAGQRVSYAVLDAPVEVCIVRRPQLEPGVVEGIWRQFADLRPLAANAIDVADVDPDAVADELAAGLDSRFLLSP
jgi:hypothetical protein